jgi:hypothetical protein
MGRLLGVMMVFTMHALWLCVAQLAVGDPLSPSSLPTLPHPHSGLCCPPLREDMKLSLTKKLPSEIAKELHQGVPHEHCPSMCAKLCLFRKTDEGYRSCYGFCLHVCHELRF